MIKFSALLQEIEDAIPHTNKMHPDVSAAAVGWHLEHILLTLSRVTDALKISDPHTYKSSFSLSKIYVFTANRIPRGRAKAPKVVQPKPDLNTDHLQRHLEEVKVKLNSLQDLPADKYFEHPYFGNLRLKPTFKFLVIHTKHHLAIVKDIISKTN